MLNVVLIGDSIRMNYQERVRQMLEGRATVQGPDDNCRFSAYTLFCLSGWVPDNEYDVIQWNNGQWDTCRMPDGRIHTPLKVYLGLQKRIANILRRKTQRLVFATTSPVHDDQYEKAVTNGRKNPDIEKYNHAAVEMLSDMGVVINDLHSALKQDVMKHISADKVHLSPDGIELCAGLVCDAVTKT